MTKKKIAIIIVTFNSQKYIGDCINSVLKYKPEDYDCRIFVVDNNSSDKTSFEVANLVQQNKLISFVKNEQNIGFAKAVNQGIREAGLVNYILLLNPDTVLNSSSFKSLLNCLHEHKVGIVGGSTFDKYGKENGSYFRYPNLQVGLFDFTNLRKIVKGDNWHKYFYYKDQKQLESPCFPVDVVTGGYMLINRKVLGKIGLFDEKFFMYLEDVDFCLRAKKNGVKIFHSNLSTITHYSGRSSNNKEGVRHTSWLWSRKIYFLKHFGIFSNLILQIVFLLDDIFILSKIYLVK